MFIVLEGIDGSGKSTQARLLADWFKEQGHEVVLTKEPGGTNIGRQIAGVILDEYNDEMAPMAEIALFAADRMQHLAEVVIPSLQAGKTVVCSRYIWSSLAYQKDLLPDGEAVVRWFNFPASLSVTPDLVIFIDIVVEAAMERLLKERDIDRIESSGKEYYEKVRQNFLELTKQYPCVIINSSGLDVKEVEVKIKEEVQEWMKRKSNY